MAPHNFVVAFGPSDSYFIAAKTSRRKKNVPDKFSSSLASSLSNPITYASLGESGRYFARGTLPGSSQTPHQCYYIKKYTSLLKHLEGREGYVCFSSGKRCSWFNHEGEDYEWACYNLKKDQEGWLNRKVKERGNKFRPILGAKDTTVLLHSDGRISMYSCDEILSNTLRRVRKERLTIRFLGLSPTRPNWFFIQFDDGSVCWNTSKEIANVLRVCAINHGFTTREAETLQIKHKGLRIESPPPAYSRSSRDL
ncbi:hypothetical protein DL96DRAFT_1562892 [Flagelloscypha sp. PMI_526]|nr:hypothetical protein DL96DRAFT_1562892 [Flagelloscypha sp. PMI_526]